MPLPELESTSSIEFIGLREYCLRIDEVHANEGILYQHLALFEGRERNVRFEFEDIVGACLVYLDCGDGFGEVYHFGES